MTGADPEFMLDPVALVASLNARALRVVTSLGFRPVSSFAATAGGRSFDILVRPEALSPGPRPSDRKA
jgi:hypothetical protein